MSDIKFAILIHAVIDQCSKMVGRSVNQKDEIRDNIKARSKLDCSLKQLIFLLLKDLLVRLMTQLGAGKNI